ASKGRRALSSRLVNFIVKPPKCFSEGIALLHSACGRFVIGLYKSPLPIASIHRLVMSRRSRKNATREKAGRAEMQHALKRHVALRDGFGN
ncbi:MAG: hypothetical protein KGM40_07735, partial [Betaproteobacteria bacterium]|nr:hypothetical protein [Betaproteobacteria bacterium]